MTRARPAQGVKQPGVREPGVKVTKRPPKRRGKRKATATIFVTKEWTVGDIVAAYPQATEVMAEYGLHCFGCAVNQMESLAEGCLGHGFTDDDVQALVADINEAIAATPPKPQTLILTKAAALAIAKIAKGESREGEGLSVQANRDGQFFLEFRKEAELGEKVFCNEEVPHIRVFASVLTLQRIGGSTIDYREGRFKLDLPEDAVGSCGCGETPCTCCGAASEAKKLRS